VGNDLTLADLYGVCGLAPVMALLPFDFPKVEDWLLGVVAPTLMDRRLAVYIIYVYVYIYIIHTYYIRSQKYMVNIVM
jgi:hypothetical protein